MATTTAEPTALALTGPQKVAIVLMQLGRERSAPILSQLREAEIEEVAGEIVRLRSVSPEVVEAVLSEFQQAFGSTTAAGGGVEVAHELLAATFGSERASAVIDRLAKAHATDAFAFLADADPRTLVSFLSGEHPQIVSVVLALVERQPDEVAALLRGWLADRRS